MIWVLSKRSHFDKTGMCSHNDWFDLQEEKTTKFQFFSNFSRKTVVLLKKTYRIELTGSVDPFDFFGVRSFTFVVNASRMNPHFNPKAGDYEMNDLKIGDKHLKMFCLEKGKKEQKINTENVSKQSESS